MPPENTPPPRPPAPAGRPPAGKTNTFEVGIAPGPKPESILEMDKAKAEATIAQAVAKRKRITAGTTDKAGVKKYKVAHEKIGEHPDVVRGAIFTQEQLEDRFGHKVDIDRLLDLGAVSQVPKRSEEEELDEEDEFDEDEEDDDEDDA